MARSDFDIVLKKEAKTSLQAFRDQSLLRRRFGEDAVRLYGLIGGERTAAELMEKLGIGEERFIEMLEFLNNNAMVSVVSRESEEGKGIAGPREDGKSSGAQEDSEGEEEEGNAEEEQEKGEGGQEAGMPQGGGPGSAFSPGRKKFQDRLLSPLERVLFEKYGEIGVRIYGLIDGEKTAEEILRQTGVSEAKLVEILEFMDEQGIIKLEKPSAPPPPPDEPEGEGGEEEKKPEQEPRFKPMIEEEPEEKPFIPPKPPEKKKEEKKEGPEEEAGQEEEVVMVDVPELAKLSLMQNALLFAELSTKFGKGAKELIDLVDGQKDFIDLSLATGLSFFDIDAIMAYFGRKGLMTFRQLAREEIKKKYGDDGFAIYKKFGREGLLLYEMIGKEASLKDIIVKSRLDVDHAIDILIFIHRVLGLDVPIDRGLIYRQLGMRK